MTPTQFRATLASVSGGGWTLSDHGSGSALHFTNAGRLSSVTDRNGNATTFGYTSTGLPASITSNRGGSAARTVTIGTSGEAITSLSQTSGSLTRTVNLSYPTPGQLGSITAADGGVTRFASANSGATVSMTGPAGMVTTVDTTGGKATTVTQTNTASGSPGSSVTRLAYPNATQTLIADPTTNQSASVAAVPHTTYALTAAQLVASATDPDGHRRSATYTPLSDVASSTPAAGGATTYSYGANSGESLTSVAAPGGASTSAAYTNSGASQYLPSSATSDAGNATKYSYNGTGNQLTTAQDTGPSATVTYNSDGTAATSASPGAASGAVTKYGYDATHQLSSITAPSGTSLGARAYTWDGYGRLATATDGHGNTTTYTYDAADRITKIAYSDPATHAVTYAYDNLGRVTSRVDGAGTTTYTWDSLGHLLSTVNTAGGGTIGYRYDRAGALLSRLDDRGTTTYTYDAAHQLSAMTYPSRGSTQTIGFAEDAAGRRTDTWLATNPDHTSWAAHTHTDYDSSGRVTHVLAETAKSGGGTYVVQNQTQCYAAGSTPPTCPTTASADRSKIQWVSDAKTGEATTYGYDSVGRLTKVTLTGGSSPRTWTYTYDAAGNRHSADVTGSATSSQTLTFNAGNQITSPGYSYDGSGNLTHLPNGTSLGYNTAGQRTTATTTATSTDYTYAGTGQAELLTQTTHGKNTYAYTYGRPDSSGVPEIERVALTTDGTTYQAYVAHDPAGLPIALQTSTGATGLYIYDGRHNPVGLLTEYPSVAYLLQFDPYGAATTTENPGGTGYPQNPYVFAGGLQDRDTGLIRYGARWYNPTTGTWTQQDTLNTPLNPANANRYTYANDDPINGIDPTGNGALVDIFGVVSFVAGAAGLIAAGPEVGTGLLLLYAFGFDAGAGALVCGVASDLGHNGC